MKSLKDNEQCNPTSSQPDNGLTVAEALQVHAGWDGALNGLPFTQGNGRFWAEGWLNFHWLRGGPARSWLRH